MRRYLLILTLCLTFFACVCPVHRAEAYVDPVTIAILAPIAIQAAKIMAPYVLRGLASMGKTGLKAGKEILNIFRLPWGIGQCMFWYFKDGFTNIVKGFCAPFKMAFYVVLMPFSGIVGAF